MIVIFLSICTYMIAFLGTVSIEPDYSKWEEGYFAVVGEKVRQLPFALCDRSLLFCFFLFNNSLEEKVFKVLLLWVL